METKRFNDLMIRFPNWISEEPDNDVYTFFGEHYTHKGEDATEKENGSYWLENTGEALIIELETSGKRYAITEEWEGEVPTLFLTPTDGSGTEILHLLPKNFKYQEKVTV